MNITAFKINSKTQEIAFSVSSLNGKRSSQGNRRDKFKEILSILEGEISEFMGNPCKLLSFSIKEKTVKSGNGEKLPVKVVTTEFEEKRKSLNGTDFFSITIFRNEIISETEESENSNRLSVKQNVSVSVLNSEPVFTEIIEKNLGAFFPTKIVSFVESEKEQSFAAGFENE
jgi:hypothetical protein